MFFFEKKNQKTFASLALREWRRHVPRDGRVHGAWRSANDAARSFAHALMCVLAISPIPIRSAHAGGPAMESIERDLSCGPVYGVDINPNFPQSLQINIPDGASKSVSLRASWCERDRKSFLLAFTRKGTLFYPHCPPVIDWWYLPGGLTVLRDPMPLSDFAYLGDLRLLHQHEGRDERAVRAKLRALPIGEMTHGPVIEDVWGPTYFYCYRGQWLAAQTD